MHKPGLVLLILAALAGAAFFVLRGGRAPLPPTPTNSELSEPTAPSTTAPLERSDAPRPNTAKPPPERPPAPGAAESPPSPAPAAAALHVHVRDLVSHEGIAAWSWRFVGSQVTVRGAADGKAAPIELPRGAAGELWIEAPGYEPFRRPLVRVDDDHEAHLDVFLRPVVKNAGIRLVVHDLDHVPVTRVRVACFGRTSGDDDRWHLDAPMWTREAAHENGDYELPPLPPGDFGVLLLAMDEQGDVLPLLPYRSTFLLTGSNGFLEDVALEPGCVLELDLRTPDGEPLAERAGDPTLDVRLAGGPAVKRRWISVGREPAVAALDRPPVAGLFRAAEPLPAGLYELTVTVHGSPRLRQSLTLRAGERQRERLLVP
jgi:hypothetical protein